MTNVTQILSQIESGDPNAAERLLPLVHEAYIRLVDQTVPQQWDSARHFFAAAAEAMRRILIERARQMESKKRGGDFQRLDLEPVEPVARASFRCRESPGGSGPTRLSPLVQDGDLVDQKRMGGLQVFHCGDDASRRKVAARIVLLADHNDARMMTTSLHDQVVEGLEIIVIPRDQDARFPNGSRRRDRDS